MNIVANETIVNTPPIFDQVTEQLTALRYAALHKLALFPMPAGAKNPTGIVKSFVDDSSADPAQWHIWMQQNPGCNFGLIAGKSRIVTMDLDIDDGARSGTWAAYSDLMRKWGLTEPPAPHVRSAHGGFHVFFRVPDGVDSDELCQPDALKGAINTRAGHGFTVYAGSYFAETKKTLPYLLISEAPPHPMPAALLDLCTRKVSDGKPVDPVGYDPKEVADLLRWMAERGMFDWYEAWLEIGFALKLEFGDAGIDLWRITYQQDKKWGRIVWKDGALVYIDEADKWRSFDIAGTSSSVTLNTIFKRAHDAGWTGTVRQTAQSMFGHVTGMGMPVPPLQPSFVQSSAEFISNFTPPDYLWDGILQRRFFYSLSAQTGTGKTAVLMRLTAHVATGRALCGHDIMQGSVLYLAGENPDDVRMRWFGVTKEMGIDPAAVTNVHFVPIRGPIVDVTKIVQAECAAKRIEPSLIIIDTSIAYSNADDENSNAQMVQHALAMRMLTLFAGGPTVIAACHPTKGAKLGEEMIPRGGGAFLAEVDGNLGAVAADGVVNLSAIGKYRGAPFGTLSFELVIVGDHPRLVDSRGRPISTVVARPVDTVRESMLTVAAQKAEDEVLWAFDKGPGSASEIARRLGWKSHTTAARAIKKLMKHKLVEECRKGFKLSPKGQIELNRMERAAPRPDLPPIVMERAGPANSNAPMPPVYSA